MLVLKFCLLFGMVECSLSDSLLILLVVSCDDLTFCHENISSKFNALILATYTVAISRQNFCNNDAGDANKILTSFRRYFSQHVNI